MNRINRQIALSLLLLVSGFTYAKAYHGNPPTEEQVAKLAAAAWKERPHSIDVTLYLELTTPPKPIEQIRQEVEEMIDQGDREYYKRKGWTKDSLPDYAAKRRKRTIEMNVTSQVKRQQFPRLIKSRIRNAGHNQRTDSVTAEPGEELEPNIPLDLTAVNSGEHNSEDFYSFGYNHKIKSATIEDESGWFKRDPAQFAYLPSGTASALQAFLGGTNQGTIAEPIFVPDPNKMQELAGTGLARIEHLRGARVNLVNRIAVSPDPNAPDTRVRVEIGDPNHFPSVVLICDREDYSHVYHLKFCSARTGEPFLIRECSNFDSLGFPRNATEVQYDIDGNLKEMSVYTIVKVELNPSIPDEVFEFRPPEGYKVTDLRSKNEQ